jgi:ADP-glucose pyrophosphorylase
MKYLIVIFLLTSCCQQKQRNLTVYMANGSGWNLSTSHIGVDSVTESTPKSATIWIDGKKTTIYADRIMFSN